MILPGAEVISNKTGKNTGDKDRLLVVSAAFPPMQAGEAEHALHLCRHLAQAGVDVHVLTGTAARTEQAETFTVHSIMRDWQWRDAPRLISTLRRLRPNAVLLIYSAWAYGHHPMVTFLPPFVHSRPGRPSFVTQMEFVDGRRSHTSLPTRVLIRAARWWTGAGLDWFYGALLRDSDRLLVLDNRYRDNLAQIDASVMGKSTLVPPPPILSMAPREDTETRRATRTAWGAAETDCVVAFFGYVYPGKGVEVLLRALRPLQGVRVVIVGGEVPDHADYARQMRNLAEELDVIDRVVWVGEYPPGSDTASRCLRAADVCALPFADGVTVNRSSFAAAAAHGLPTVTTQGPSLDPIFVDGENVLLCPPDDPRRAGRLPGAGARRCGASHSSERGHHAAGAGVVFLGGGGRAHAGRAPDRTGGPRVKIAIWHNLPSGGGKRALSDHVKGLVERGHRVESWCPSTADQTYLPLSDSIQEHIVPLKDEPRTRWQEMQRKLTSGLDITDKVNAMQEHSRECARQMKQGGFDLLFANSCQSFAAPFIGRYADMPKVLYLQEPYRAFYEARPELPWIAPAAARQRKSLRTARTFYKELRELQGVRIQAREELTNAQAFDTLLVNSYFSRESVLRAYNINAQVCYLGIDTSLFQGEEPQAREDFIVGIGAFDPRKNIEAVIEAVAATAPPASPSRLDWQQQNAGIFGSPETAGTDGRRGI